MKSNDEVRRIVSDNGNQSTIYPRDPEFEVDHYKLPKEFTKDFANYCEVAIAKFKQKQAD